MSEYFRNCQRHYSHYMHADGYPIVWRGRARELPWGHETRSIELALMHFSIE